MKRLLTLIVALAVVSLVPTVAQGLWRAEAHSPDTRVCVSDSTVEVETPLGLTLWYDRPLSGSYDISYRAVVVDRGGPCDRVSDLNCFWGATDPDNPDDIHADADARRGIFERYKSLRLYYVGYGGNHNTTTRFRRYYGGGAEAPDSIARPLIAEYTDKAHLLLPNVTYDIHITVRPHSTAFTVNGETIFTRAIDPGECDGYFGLRLLSNHVIITDFKVNKP